MITAETLARFGNKPAEAPKPVVEAMGFDLETYTARHGFQVIRCKPWQSHRGGTIFELARCPFNPDHVGGSAAFTQLDGVPGFSCKHNGCHDKTIKDVFARYATNGANISDNSEVIAPLQVEYWPDPIRFNSRRIEPFPPDLLPGFVGEHAQVVARATETPIELAALLGLAVASASIASKFVISPEPGYIEPLNIYTCPAMESGNRKTAVLGHMAFPLLDWEQEEADRLKPTINKAQSARKTQEARIDKLRKQAAASDEPQLLSEIEKLEGDLKDVPALPRLVVQDVTPEKLAMLMSEQGERMALLSDEGGIFDLLAGRYAKEPNLDLFLQAHSGSPVIVDRGSRPSVQLRHPVLTIGLSPQPAVLHTLSAKPAFRGRGLIARFLFGVPESHLGYRKLDPIPVSEQARSLYRAGMYRLLNLSCNQDAAGRSLPKILTFSPGAYTLWKDFQRAVELLMREGGKLAPFRDWGSKLPGAAARIAGILHGTVRNDQSLIIESHVMDASLETASLLIDHALAAFEVMQCDPVVEEAKKLLRWIQMQGANRFTVHTCFCAHQYRFKRVDAMRPALGLLEQHRYIRRCANEKASHRPSETYLVNPAIVGGQM